MVAVLVSLCNLIDRDMGTLLVGMLNLNGVDVIAKCSGMPIDSNLATPT